MYRIRYKHMIVKLPRLYKKITMLSIDVVMIYLVLILSISLRLGQVYVPHDEMLMIVAVAPFIAIPIFIKFGLYRAIVRYIGFSALWAIIQAVSIYATFWGLAALMLKIDGFPRSVIIINFLFAMLFIGGTRMIARWYFSSNRKAGVDDKNIVIYGATDQGVQLSYVLNNIQGLNPVFFIDDNPLLYGHNINGLKVYSYNDLPRLKDIYDVDEVFLALPKISKEKKLDILNKLYKLSLTIKTVPLITDITTENFKINDIAVSWKKKGYDVDVLTLAPTYPYGKVFDSYKNKIISKDTFHGVNIIRIYAVTGYKESKTKKIIKLRKPQLQLKSQMGFYI